MLQKKYGLTDRPTNLQIERHCIHETCVKFGKIKSVWFLFWTHFKETSAIYSSLLSGHVLLIVFIKQML
jgi:hypothetical protein